MKIVKQLVLVLVLFSLNQLYLYSADPVFSVSGVVKFEKKYDISIEVINKVEYWDNLNSEYAVIIAVNEEVYAQKRVSFAITGIPAGDYLVKVYQDMNGNRKFDFALFGGEPLGTHKKPGFVLFRPSFKSLAFTLNQDLAGIEVEL